ncbi:LOW QUALITY PROTEIN: hypothetical protein CFC21_004640 [Triticum aestivum]|uniref:4-hydroxyphenylpyruvate dioxygenase n=2 Tax=Triticum aestivum TaxID=4565 RepID=A0A3B5YPS5_WHEAT|nr:LOW QUALITY PROTEIN: hypothetical protein CFC21_004640 [Triticum aestivum]
MVRFNPGSDRFHTLAFHHIEFWCTDAASADGRFAFSLGAPLAARSDLSTGNSTHASQLLRPGSLAFLFTAPYANGCIFSVDAARRFFADHGLAVRSVALRVADAAKAFRASVDGGARPAFAPVDLGRGFGFAEVKLYGDVVLRFVSHPDGTDVPFLPGLFEGVSNPGAVHYGLTRFDHIVGNVPELAPAAAYVAGLTGFHEFAEFTTEDVGTAQSGLNSVVLANTSEGVPLLLNEPVHGTKRRRQIQTFLEHHGGPGVQHIAVASSEVFRTLREMHARSSMGGFDFLPPPLPKYYEGVRRLAGDVLSEAQIKECQELGVLVNRDDQGVLLQIFTKPVGDRPTFFLEMIQRIGCMEKDERGEEYQKGGCGGFGKGNISELFKSIEDYEKSLEAKQSAAVQGSYI